LETETITGDEGVYRVTIEPNCDYDRVDISLGSEDQDLDTSDIAALSEEQGPGEVAWVMSSAYSILTHISPSFQISAIKYTNIYTSSPVQVTVNYEHDVPSGAINGSSLLIMLLDEDFNIIDSHEISTGSGTSSGNPTFTLDPEGQVAVYLGFQHYSDSAFAGQSRMLVDAAQIEFTGNLSETKQYKIDCGCRCKVIA